MWKSGEQVRAVVASLAAALDGDDFDAVHALFDRDCVYEIGDERHVGPEAIVASYRAGSALGRELFNDVEFDHEILGDVGDKVWRVRYVDRLRAGDETFVHISEQDVTVDPERGIVRIVDVPILGKHERLDAFMERHGITR